MSARLLRILADLGHPVVARSADLATSVKVIDLTLGGVRVTLTLTASSRAERSPDMQESARFLKEERDMQCAPILTNGSRGDVTRSRRCRATLFHLFQRRGGGMSALWRESAKLSNRALGRWRL